VAQAVVVELALALAHLEARGLLMRVMVAALDRGLATTTLVVEVVLLQQELTQLELLLETEVTVFNLQ
jgi:hypothetical protein